jgi:hypothetical protein
MKTSLLFLSRAAVRCGVVLALLCITFTQVHSQALQWEQTNGPYGGTINCFAQSGTSLFVGTQGSGVFRSTDNGISWKSVNSGLPLLSQILAFATDGISLFVGQFGYNNTDGSPN